MADVLGQGQLDQVGDEGPDYLGRLVTTAFRNQPSLPTAGSISGKAAAPAGVSGTGTTPLAGSVASASPTGAESSGPTTLQQIARALGLSEQALKASSWAKNLFGPDAGETAGKIDAGQIVPESASLAFEGAGPTATAIDTGAMVPESASLAEGAVASDTGGMAWGPALAAAARLGMGGYQASQAEGDQAKAAQVMQAIGMAIADYYTGGAAELGPMIGNLIGTDSPIGALLTGFPALMNPALGKSRHTMLEQNAMRQGDQENQLMRRAFSEVPNDPGSTFGALRAQLDPQNKVRSYFTAPEGMEGFAPGMHEWSAMAPEQFMGVMNWLAADPARLSQVGGSGDIAYLDQNEAGAVGGQAAGTARALIARELGLPYLDVNGGRGYEAYRSEGEVYDAQGLPMDAGVATANETRYQQARQSWYSQHPDVAPSPWSPAFIQNQPITYPTPTPAPPMTPEAAMPQAFPADDFSPAASFVTGGGLRERELLEGE